MDRPHLHDLRQKILVTTLPLLYCLRHCLCCTVKDTASAVLSKTLPLPCVLPLPFVAKTLPFLADLPGSARDGGSVEVQERHPQCIHHLAVPRFRSPLPTPRRSWGLLIAFRCSALIRRQHRRRLGLQGDYPRAAGVITPPDQRDDQPCPLHPHAVSLVGPVWSIRLKLGHQLLLPSPPAYCCPMLASWDRAAPPSAPKR